VALGYRHWLVKENVPSFVGKLLGFDPEQTGVIIEVAGINDYFIPFIELSSSDRNWLDFAVKDALAKAMVDADEEVVQKRFEELQLLWRDYSIVTDDSNGVSTPPVDRQPLDHNKK